VTTSECFFACSARGLTVRAPAKVNLFLEVKSKRADGFHEVETLMVPIGLYDTLIMGVRDDHRVCFRCESLDRLWSRSANRTGEIDAPGNSDSNSNSNLGHIPQDSSNIVVKALELLRRRADVRFGVNVHLTKRIPAGAGLGGGSSDAAAALRGANSLWKMGFSRLQLCDLATELGSDVPFFLEANSAVCRGRGERVEPIGPIGPLHLVLARPPASLSTPDVYHHCRVPTNNRSVTAILEALRKSRIADVGRLLFNRLQAPAQQLCHWIALLESFWDEQDCLGHAMTGSGTCYFALCRSARQASRLARRLENAGLGAAVYVPVLP
jgi:4-diphosphocytidyl-2-C-methyl-D-erythritol kinase